MANYVCMYVVGINTGYCMTDHKEIGDIRPLRKYRPQYIEVILLDLHHLGITYFCGNKNTKFTTDSVSRTMVCVFDNLFAILKVKH